MRVEPAQLDQLLHPVFDPKAEKEVIAKGINASPGAATGKAVFTADDAVAWTKEKGEKVILVRLETRPDDIHGMDKAVGILTARGGATSHAAVVARQMGKVCVAGCEDLKVDEHNKTMTVKGTDLIIKEGDWISIDGTTGAGNDRQGPDNGAENGRRVRRVHEMGGRIKGYQSKGERRYPKGRKGGQAVRRARE